VGAAATGETKREQVDVHGVLAGLQVASGPALFAQSYPAQPIRLVVGFQAGGATDIAARAIGQKLTEALGQSVIVDNRPALRATSLRNWSREPRLTATRC